MVLDSLYNVIIDRIKSPSPNSYVSKLVSGGKDRILKKIGEEAAEVIIASKSGERSEIISEMADLWFHCIVFMANEGISHSEVLDELEKRFGNKGEAK